MPQNPITFDDETQALLDILVSTYVAIISNETGLHPNEISMADHSRTIFNDDAESFGTVLAKLHLYNDIQINYKQYTEFELFETLGDAFDFVAEKVLKKEGYSEA